MIITDAAKEHIEQMFETSAVKAIRIYFAGMGWGGPRIEMALAEPSQKDIIQEINGLQVAIDRPIKDYVEHAVLDFQSTMFGQGLILKGAHQSSC